MPGQRMTFTAMLMERGTPYCIGLQLWARDNDHALRRIAKDLPMMKVVDLRRVSRRAAQSLRAA